MVAIKKKSISSPPPPPPPPPPAAPPAPAAVQPSGSIVKKGVTGVSGFDPATPRPPVEINPAAAAGKLAAMNALAAKAEERETRNLADELHTQLADSVQKPVGEWTATEAAQYTDVLATQIEAHRDNPELVRTMMTDSGTQLERSAAILGQASEEKNLYNGDDVKATAANLSRIGNAAPEDAAARLAYGVASAIPEDSEQHKVDDGFSQFIENGGDSRFRDMVASALQSQGKGDASEELVEHQGGSSIGDRLRDGGEVFTELAQDAGGAIYDFGMEAFDTVVDGAKTAAGALADGARRFADKAGDVVQDAAEEARELGGTVKDGIVEGAQWLGDKAAGPLRDAAQGAFINGLKIEEKVNSLGEGDELAVGGGVDIDVGFTFTASADLQIRHNTSDQESELGGQYTVTGEAGALVGLKRGGALSLGASGKAEFTFATKEEAIQGAKTLALLGASAAGGAPVAALLKPEGDDIGHLMQNVSALEASVDGALNVEAALPGSVLEGTASAGLKSSPISYRFEFNDGSLSSMIRKQTLEGTVGASASANLLSGRLPADVQLETLNGEAKAKVVLSTKVDYSDGVSVGDVLRTPITAINPVPISSSLIGAKTGLEATLEYTGGSNPAGGAEISITTPEIALGDGFRVATDLMRGRFSDALHELPQTTISGRTFRNTGFEVAPSISGGRNGVSVGVNAHRTVKDYTDWFGPLYPFGTDAERR